VSENPCAAHNDMSTPHCEEIPKFMRLKAKKVEQWLWKNQSIFPFLKMMLKGKEKPVIIREKCPYKETNVCLYSMENMGRKKCNNKISRPKCN
jgi:hypothetical protein